MEEIILKMASSAESEQFVCILIRNGFKPTEATINYSLKENSSVKLSKVKDFPLILNGTLNGHQMRVAVTQLVIGRHCDGSYALRKILKTAGFYLEETDLFTTRRFNPKTGRLSLTLTQR